MYNNLDVLVAEQGLDIHILRHRPTAKDMICLHRNRTNHHMQRKERLMHQLQPADSIPHI